MAVAVSAQEAAINWQLWCRLCAKDDAQSNINVFMKNEQTTGDALVAAGSDLTLATAIGKYFWVNITRGEELPEMICPDCLTLITSLVNFSERITKVQKMYCILQSTPKQEPLNVQELRSRFGLVDEECEAPVPLPQTLPEVHYVLDEKPKMNAQGMLEETALELVNPLTPCVPSPEQEDNKSSNSNASDDNSEASLALNEGAYAEDTLTPTPSDEEHSSDSGQTNGSARTAKTKRKRSKSKPTNYPCAECPKVFTWSKSMQRHMRQEHAKPEDPQADASAELLPCTDCNKQFRTRYQLQRHAQQHLPMPKRKIYPCGSCGKKFTSHASAQSHAQYMHLDERPRPFICEQCGVGVHSNSALKEHMLSHTDYAPYECEVCKKCFKSASRLKHHKETHDPHKYICPECGMQLNSRPTLNRHRLVHTDQMQHKCDYCGREFKRAKALKNHLILHTGLKPYNCDFCERTFANGSNCRTHKKKAHPEELAAQEAAGVAKSYNRNIPKLAALKAFTKNKDNLSPVATKQSGCFAFGKKPKPKSVGNEDAATPTAAAAIPTIDNIYNHIMKQTKEDTTNYSAEQLLLATNSNAALLTATATPTSHIEQNNANAELFPY